MPDVAILLLMTQLQWLRPLAPTKRALRRAGGIHADCRVKINEVVFVPAVLTEIIRLLD